MKMSPLIAANLIEHLRLDDLCEGWPPDCYGVTDHPVWHVYLRDSVSKVGASRVIVISQVTGAIVADENVGE